MARNFVRASSQYLVTPAPFVTAMPFTVSAWYYPFAFVASEQNVIVGSAAPGEYWLLVTIDDPYGSGTNWKLRAQISTTGQVSYPNSTNLFLLNQWNHTALTASLSQRIPFLNGIKGQINTDPITQFAGTLPYSSIGAYYVGTTPAHCCQGRIAEVGIWNVVLTDDELIALSKGVSPLMVRPAALQSCLPVYGNSDPEPNLFPKNGIVGMGAVNAPAKAEHTRVYQPWQSTLNDTPSSGWGRLLGQERNRLVLQP